MLDFLRKIIPERHPLRLLYHKIMAMVFSIWYRFPSSKMTIIAITGTSGKSSVMEIAHFLLQKSGVQTGAISTTSIWVGNDFFPNNTLRSSLRPSDTQRWLKTMVGEDCQVCLLEMTSHGIDQDRFWGVNIDTSVLTNITDNEHLDYHGTFTDYLKTKLKIFQKVNFFTRKPGIPKTIILNADDENFDLFDECVADFKWTFSIKRPSNFRAENIELLPEKTKFSMQLPNNRLEITMPLVGHHNLENAAVAIAIASSYGVDPEKISSLWLSFTGIPGRMEPIDEGQFFSVLVDFSYKPSALKAILNSLRKVVRGKIIVLWGGAGGRSIENWQESARVIEAMADEFILTTDDPYQEDPAHISACICEALTRKEGDRFFEIEDRYEAIRYGLYTAEEDDCVLVAGRGVETMQTIKSKKIPFDDRTVVREVLQLGIRRGIIPQKTTQEPAKKLGS